MTDWFPHPRLRLTLYFIRFIRVIGVSRRWRSGGTTAEKVRVRSLLTGLSSPGSQRQLSRAPQSSHTIHIQTYFRSHINCVYCDSFRVQTPARSVSQEQCCAFSKLNTYMETKALNVLRHIIQLQLRNALKYQDVKVVYCMFTLPHSFSVPS